MYEAGLKGNFTGHTRQVTPQQQLYQIGVDELLIKERTGHRSDAVSEQQCTLSKILDPLFQRVSMPSPVRSKKQKQVLH